MTVLEAELGSPLLENLVPRFLAFQRNQSRLKWSSITLYIIKNMRRGRTVIVQYQDSNSPVFVDEQF